MATRDASDALRELEFSSKLVWRGLGFADPVYKLVLDIVFREIFFFFKELWVSQRSLL